MLGGTGSNPHLDLGLHLKILLKANTAPLNSPCSLTACTAYEEHVG